MGYYNNMYGKINKLVICKEKYKNNEEFENAIKNAIMSLLNNEYIMTVRYDEKGLGIVCIDYNYDDEEMGCAMPYWLSPEEFDSVVWEDENE